MLMTFEMLFLAFSSTAQRNKACHEIILGDKHSLCEMGKSENYLKTKEVPFASF